MRSLTLLAAAVLATAACVPSAHADSISTGAPGVHWKLVGIDQFGAPPSTPGLANLLNDAPVITANPGWGATTATTAIADADPAAQWISASSDGAAHGVWGWYTFELTLNNLTPGLYTISGTYSADNFVDSLKINGTEMVSAIPAAGVYAYNFTYDFATFATLNNSVTITARVYNESQLAPQGYPTGPSDPNGIDNPIGFILGGEIDYSAALPSVPTPAAALGGLALLPLLAFSQLRRRRSASTH